MDGTIIRKVHCRCGGACLRTNMISQSISINDGVADDDSKNAFDIDMVRE